MGILSALGLTSGNDGGAADTLREAVNEWRSVKIPTPEELGFIIEQYKADEAFTSPEQLYTGDLKQGETGLNALTTRQSLLDAQNNAVGDLTQVANEGITATENADIRRLLTTESGRQRGAREAILQNYQERGLAGAGGELAAQLLNQQSSADRGAQSALDISALGKQRALEALIASGNLAGSVRGQEFSEGASKASAQDAINAFNLNQEVATRGKNFNRNFDAAGARQQIANANVDKTTQQRKQVGDNLKFGMEAGFNKAAGQANALAGVASQQSSNARAQDDRLSNTLLSGATAVGNYFKPLKNGGDFEANETILVGEEGPEMMTMGEGGHVTNNPDTSALLSSLSGVDYKPTESNDDLVKSTLTDLQKRIARLENI